MGHFFVTMLRFPPKHEPRQGGTWGRAKASRFSCPTCPKEARSQALGTAAKQGEQREDKLGRISSVAVLAEATVVAVRVAGWAVARQNLAGTKARTCGGQGQQRYDHKLLHLNHLLSKFVGGRQIIG